MQWWEKEKGVRCLPYFLKRRWKVSHYLQFLIKIQQRIAQTLTWYREEILHVSLASFVRKKDGFFLTKLACEMLNVPVCTNYVKISQEGFRHFSLTSLCSTTQVADNSWQLILDTEWSMEIARCKIAVLKQVRKVQKYMWNVLRC